MGSRYQVKLNVHLTRRALFNSLCQSAKTALQPEQFQIPRDGFFEEIKLNFTEYDEGCEQHRPYQQDACTGAEEG